MSALRLYTRSGPDGYPAEWHATIKHQVRAEAGNRCIRCGHPYPPYTDTESARGEWSRCDERCTHNGEFRIWLPEIDAYAEQNNVRITPQFYANHRVEARWRILTVHHLDGNKLNCRWWNLAALCQRCHLTIQGKVHMERRWLREHSDWFKPYVAGFYAFNRLGLDLTRPEVEARLDELLALEDRQLELGASV